MNTVDWAERKRRREWLRKWRKTPAGRRKQKKDYAAFKNSPCDLAKRKVYTEVSGGRMVRASTLKCVDCNAPAKVYDHRDYDKPLEVEPVCVSCNTKRGPAKHAKRSKVKK